MAEYAPKYCEPADESPSHGGVAWVMSDTFDLNTLADYDCNQDSEKSANALCNRVVPLIDTDSCFGVTDLHSDQEPLATPERHDSGGEALLVASSGEGDTHPPIQHAPTDHTQSTMVHAYLTQGLRPSQINFPLSHASKLFHYLSLIHI